MLTLFNLGGGGRNLTELNNSKLLCQISMKFCMVVGPHERILCFHFSQDWMKDDITVTSQQVRVTTLRYQLIKMQDLRHNDVIICVFG